MYLLDTSIILEFLLDQEKADDVEWFLRETRLENLYISDFTLYSLGIALLRRNMHEAFLRVANDLLVLGGVHLARVAVEDMENIVSAVRRFNIDFDDAYQYTIAAKYSLTILSFDSDFDRTDLGRRVPAEIIQG